MVGGRAVVIGSGMAGSLAALTASKALSNAQVLVLDKERSAGGNSALASSGINALTRERGDSAAAFIQDTLRSGGGLCKPDLVGTLVNRSQEALRFLEAAGVDLSAVTQTGGQSVPRTRSPPAGAPAVGAAIMGALQRSMAERPNLQLRTGARVIGLRRAAGSGGRGTWCVEVAATGDAAEGGSGVHTPEPQQQKEEALHAEAVVLATGGYAASQELLQRYAPYAAGLGTTNGAFAAGDGLLLGQQAGAAAVDLEWVQLNPTGILDTKDPHSRSGAPRVPAPEKLRGLGAILANAEGRRFVDELATRDRVAEAILLQPGRRAVLLCGSETAAAFGEEALAPYLSGGLLVRGGSLQHLAEDTGLPEGALAQEIAAYDAAAAAGRDGFGKRAFPARIDPGGPLVWAAVAPVAHYCMGGLAIDSRARVLDREGRPIPGLFAAGEVTGGVHGRNLLVGNSLLECVVFGRIAGEEAAAHAASEAERCGAAGC